jgi:hypothetical protein
LQELHGYHGRWVKVVAENVLEEDEWEEDGERAGWNQWW